MPNNLSFQLSNLQRFDFILQLEYCFRINSSTYFNIFSGAILQLQINYIRFIEH